MALKQEDLQIIGEYVQSHLTEWLPGHVSTPVGFSYPIELAERMIRVEEELKNQRELMKLGFDNMNKRFEQVDKNFNEVNTSIRSLQTKMFQFMIWSYGFTATVAGIIIAVIKFM